ncbi:hypothetical protein [uncultured Cohaesibacter sp.]|uniref:hypothetical protein n=1 Tax=uncultured Cohaesibacter sp. TaxID=1002546 RepID=UPI002AAADB99|nr:hypothetical protein [uncultured Cohaesibacter sp.]
MPTAVQHGSAVIVDGNTFQRKLLRSILRTSGFIRVVEFDKLEFGLDEAKRTFPNFLFLDYDTASSSELLRGRPDISKTYLAEATYLIFIMENPTRYRVTSAIAHGAHWIISRPFSTNALNARIQAAMNPDQLDTSTPMVSSIKDNLALQTARIANRDLDPVSLSSVTSSSRTIQQDDFFENDMFDDYDEIFQRKSGAEQSEKDKAKADADTFLI